MTTWTERPQQSEVWTTKAKPARTFSPLTFSRRPIFDTGSMAGTWTEKTKQSETWAES